MPYTPAPKVEAIEGRTPTPRVKGNLPAVQEGGPDRGREVPPVKPMEWFERANPRSSGGGSLKVGPWEKPPKPPEGFPSRDITTPEELATLHKRQPEFYRKGGLVKHGSSTCVHSRSKS